MSLWLPLCVGVIAWLGTAAMLRYARARNLIDTPNDRSSHSTPTPRGGGAAIVVAMLAGLAVATVTGHVPGTTLLGYAGAGLGVALLGFLDDHGHVKARWRLLGHFMAAAWLVFWLGPVQHVLLGSAHLALSALSGVLSVIGVVWLLNLYNFMDGIDGLAGGQAVSVCLVACVLYTVFGDTALLAAPLCLLAAAAGFLVLNWPPARIFMGDVGSGFVGLMIGGLLLEGAQAKPGYLWMWLVLMAAFIGDATWTLARRAARGAKVYEAHRSHTYQKAALALGAHRKVTTLVLAFNLLWLGTLAIGCIVAPAWGLAWIILAYAPVLYMARRYGAGLG